MTPSKSVELEAAVERLRETKEVWHPEKEVHIKRRYNRDGHTAAQVIEKQAAALSASNARAVAAEEALRKAATDMRQQAEASAGNLKRFGCDAHMVDICLGHFKYQADRIDATLASMKEKR